MRDFGLYQALEVRDSNMIDGFLHQIRRLNLAEYATADLLLLYLTPSLVASMGAHLVVQLSFPVFLMKQVRI